MTYSITNSNGTMLVTIPDGIIDNTTTDLTLVGNNAPNFGQAVNQNFINLLQNWAKDTAPPNPTIGQLWYDTNTTVLKVYQGTIWAIASQQINLSASSVPFNLTTYSGNPSMVATICNDTIVAITSVISISNSNLPTYIILNNKSYLLQSLFSNGLISGTTFANPTSYVVGPATSTNELIPPTNLILTGAASGNVGINGLTDINLTVSFSNVYMDGNTTVGGNWSNVTVNDSGQVIWAGNILFDDVVNALTYIPFDSANITPNLISDTVISRDYTGSFAANIMLGTSTGTQSFTPDLAIFLDGAVIGQTNLTNFSSNVLLSSNLIVNSNIDAGIYNTLGVGGNGLIQTASLIDNMPIGSIVLFNQPVIPTGWAACNGQVETLPNGYSVTLPSMSNAIVGFVDANAYFGSIYADVCGVPVTANAGPPGTNNIYVGNSNANIEVVWSTQIGAIYIMHIFTDTNVPTGIPTVPNLETNLVSGDIQLPQLVGGANITYPNIVYNSNIQSNPTDQLFRSTPLVYNYADAQNLSSNVFYDATALLLSAGDVNAVMMSAVDIYGDLSKLLVQQIVFNLQNRQLQGLPPKLGKYMLSLTDIINYMDVLDLPLDQTLFTIALQDEIMLLKVSDISNRYIADNIYPDDTKLFGAVYIGYLQYLAIMQASESSTVGNALVSAGFDVTGDVYTDNLLCFEFIETIQALIISSMNAITQNQTAISVTTQLNEISQQQYDIPIYLIQQPENIVGNVYSDSNITITTIDGLDNYYGGNINLNVSPGFGGGAFPYTSVQSSTSYYSILAQSRYLNSGIKTTNNTLNLSWSTGLGIKVDDSTNILIGDLAISKGTVNTVVGPVDTPQPTIETLQNILVIDKQLTAGSMLRSVLNTTTSQGINTQTTTQLSTQTVISTSSTSITEITTVNNVTTLGSTVGPTTINYSTPQPITSPVLNTTT